MILPVRRGQVNRRSEQPTVLLHYRAPLLGRPVKTSLANIPAGQPIDLMHSKRVRTKGAEWLTFPRLVRGTAREHTPMLLACPPH